MTSSAKVEVVARFVARPNRCTVELCRWYLARTLQALSNPYCQSVCLRVRNFDAKYREPPGSCPMDPIRKCLRWVDLWRHRWRHV